MPSNIDPTKPQDGVPASKADLRANLQAAKTEIEALQASLTGGSFTHQAAGALSASVGDSLGGMWANVKMAFGAVGNNSADDTQALQAAIDSGWPLFFPPGIYKITAPLRYTTTPTLLGVSGKVTKSPDPLSHSEIRGNFSGPLLHRNGGFLTWNNLRTGTWDEGGGVGAIVTNMVFHNAHLEGCCFQVMGGMQCPLFFSRCMFFCGHRGLLLLHDFNSFVENCQFKGVGNLPTHLASGEYVNAYGLYASGHSTIIGCDIQGAGCGIQVVGSQANVFSCRIEVSGVALRCGGPNLNQDGINFPLSRSRISGISGERNQRGIWIFSTTKGVAVSEIDIQGSSAPPMINGGSEYGLLVESDNTDIELSNINATGEFTQAGVIFRGKTFMKNITTGSNSSGKPFYGGISTIFGERSSLVRYRVINYPLNPDVNPSSDRNSVTAFHDLQLRGIKGLNIRDANVLPKNLGGLEAVGEGATTLDVAFPGTVSTSAIAFQNKPSVTNDANSTLEAGTYYYAVTAIGRHGETGMQQTQLGVAYKQAVVSAGQRVTLNFLGTGTSSIFRRRLYRGRPVGGSLGFFEGFWEFPIDQSSFVDDGNTALTGRDMPPTNDYSLPSLAETDANYAIVVTPSWLTSAWVTNKATTGFTIKFDPDPAKAAPLGATVQWLLFRP